MVGEKNVLSIIEDDLGEIGLCHKTNLIKEHNSSTIYDKSQLTVALFIMT